MKPRRLVAAVVAGTAMATAAPVAIAGTYPPPVSAAQGTAVPSRIEVGGSTTFAGGGFRADTRLDIADNAAPVRTIRADGAGEFSTKIYFNGDAKPGRHVLSAKGTGAHGEQRTVTATVEVLGERVSQGDIGSGGRLSAGATGSNGGRLAFTGLDVVGIVVAGLLLVVVGSLVLMASERRYRRRMRARDT